MLHRDINKVKVGDLWVKGDFDAPSVVVKVNKKTIDIYHPKKDGKVRVSKMVLQDFLDYDGSFYFEDGDLRPI